VQVQGVASFPIPLKFHEKVKLNYRNETEALTSTAPCTGSVDEPVISPPGNFCAYRGGKLPGATEKAPGDENVTSKPFFSSFGGEKIEETGEAGAGDDGVLIVFRTVPFNTTTPETIPAGQHSTLNAIGSWAVAAK